MPAEDDEGRNPVTEADPAAAAEAPVIPAPADPGAPPPGPPPPSATVPGGGRRWAPLIAIAAVLSVLVLTAEATFVGWALTRSHNSHFQAATQAPAQAPIQTVPQTGEPASGQGLNVESIAAKVDPAIVDINTTLATTGQAAQAAGTGMILTSNGEILTNHHVVQGATRIEVTVQGRSSPFVASVVGVDTAHDVAMLKLQNVSGLPTVKLADTSTLKVGEPVVAIGNALGQGGTPRATQGTITALNQSITASSGGGRTERLTGLIQSDAPISEGDSGGPLVNSAGQVIGMITAGASQGRQASTTIGYAIPSSTTVQVLNQIRSGQPGPGIVLGLPGYLGVSVRNLDAATAAQLGLQVGSGAFVTGVAPNTPAAQAGITANSVITAIDGASITSADQLGPAIQSHKPGQKMQVTWVDKDGSHTASVTLISGPSA